VFRLFKHESDLYAPEHSEKRTATVRELTFRV